MGSSNVVVCVHWDSLLQVFQMSYQRYVKGTTGAAEGIMLKYYEREKNRQTDRQTKTRIGVKNRYDMIYEQVYQHQCQSVQINQTIKPFCAKNPFRYTRTSVRTPYESEGNAVSSSTLT
jgi:hypothetical protein